MSKLEYYSRPLVAFDPYKKEHRRYYGEFLKKGGWGTCPVRFICPDEVGLSLPDIIRQQLVTYYIEREFQIKPRPGSFGPIGKPDVS
jgi:hypothetical protein